MSDLLKNKYLFIEVTKSPPRASLCGPQRIISKIRSFSSWDAGVQCEEFSIGNVMQIRLTGTEGKHDSTFLKMALLYEALNLKYEPMTLQSVSDSLVLTRSKEVE